MKNEIKMKHFRVHNVEVMRCGAITLAYVQISSKETGEVFEATGCAKCSPEDQINPIIGNAVAMKKALEKVARKSYRSTLRLAEAKRKEAERLSDLAMSESQSFAEQIESLNQLIHLQEIGDIEIE